MFWFFILKMSFIEVFQPSQLVPDHFSAEKNGIELFPRYFLYRYYFVKDAVKDGKMIKYENYVTVKRDTDEFILYSPKQVEFTDDEMKTMLKKNESGLTAEQAEKYTNGMIWWGKFIEDFKFYLSTSNNLNDFCNCETKKERKEIMFVYKIHGSTMKKYLSMIDLMSRLCECKCNLHYWLNQLVDLPEEGEIC